jgi:hypothetical protein
MLRRTAERPGSTTGPFCREREKEWPHDRTVEVADREEMSSIPLGLLRVDTAFVTELTSYRARSCPAKRAAIKALQSLEPVEQARYVA